MPDIIPLTCPSCGGSLQIPKNIERFACIQCGTEHIVKRGGGIITLEPVVHDPQKVDEPLIEARQPAMKKNKKHLMGILSFIAPFMNIFVCCISCLIVLVALDLNRISDHTGLLSFGLILPAIITVAGLILGIISVTQKNRSRVFAIIGIILNSTQLIAWVFIFDRSLKDWDSRHLIVN